MDTHLLAFLLEMTLSLALSAIILALLQPVLTPLLTDLCRGEGRAAFWSTFTRLMLFIAPLLVVILFTRSITQSDLLLAETLRSTLMHALFGQFVGLLIIGKVLFNFTRQSDKEKCHGHDNAITDGRG